VKLTIRPAARQDILHQYRHYLTLDLPHVAERFLASVENSIDALMAAPKAGSPRHFANPLLAGLRSWPVKGFEEFRIYYLERPCEVAVARILHGRRDIGAILEDERDDEAGTH
jgi:toxin ParE1/3/4